MNRAVMDEIAVLIPCYNEEQTIAKVIRDAKKVLPSAVIYVYNNNSTDDTAKVAISEGAIVRNEYMQGKGNVIRRMFREIDAKCYLMIDGDDTYSLENAEKMCRLVLEKNADMVVGDRLSSTYFTENKRRFHGFGNALVRWTINRFFDCDIRDIMTGFRALSYDFVKTFSVLSKGFEIETEMTIHAVFNNMQVENVIIQYRDRISGSESKLCTYTDGMRILKTIAHLYKNYMPMKFFGLLSLVLLLLALGFFFPVWTEYRRTGLVEKFPTLIVCGFTLIASIQSLFSGMIISGMARKSRCDFEMRRNALYRK